VVEEKYLFEKIFWKIQMMPCVAFLSYHVWTNFGVHYIHKCIKFWMFLSYRFVFCLTCSWEISSFPSPHLKLLCLRSITFHATSCKVVFFLTIEPLVMFGNENMGKGARGPSKLQLPKWEPTWEFVGSLLHILLHFNE
jgi:hypothetical protein